MPWTSGQGSIGVSRRSVRGGATEPELRAGLSVLSTAVPEFILKAIQMVSPGVVMWSPTGWAGLSAVGTAHC